MTDSSTSFAARLALALVAGLLLGTAGCSQEQPASAPAAPKVGVYVVQSQPYTVTATLPGRASAYMVSDVRPQIDGIIEKRLFTEGTEVKAGQVLYQIDARRYQAAYDSSKAELSQARAAVESARPLAERYEALARMDAISKQDRDNAVASLAQERANVATAQANLESARINLDFTRIKAPISGRIGASVYTPGALVTANQADALASINKLDPIFVDIQQSVAQYLTLKQAVDSGQLETDTDNAAPVQVTPEGASTPMTGKLQFAGVSVNQDTGSVMLRAIVPNADHTLLPGMYVRTQLVQGIDVKSILLPQQAVSRDASGQPTALVVDANDKVVQHKLEIAGATDDNRWRVTSGLKIGDRVVVQGSEKAKVGQAVQPTQVDIAANGSVKTVPGPQSGRADSTANTPGQPAASGG